MPKGGYREGSGRKFKWKSGKTKTIRVPEALADEILDYARKLDQGIESKVNSSMEIDLAGVSLVSISGQMGVRLIDLVKRGYQLKPKTLDRFISVKSLR